MSRSGRPIVFRGVRVFDGSQILSDDTVVVENATIAAVGKHLPTPSGATVIEGNGQTLLPGLIDAHTHTFGPALQQALIFGVTTELDMFTDWRLAKTIKEQQAKGLAQDLPDLHSAGTAITVPGGHGIEFGLPIPTINSPDDAQEFVDARLAEGSDYIKIMYDDGKSLGRSFNNMSKSTLAAVVAAAHRRGKLAVVHIMGLDGARDAINAGADVLAHLFFDQGPDAEFGKWVAEHGASVIPTLTLLDNITGGSGGTALIADAMLAPYLTRSDMHILKSKYPPLRFNTAPNDVIRATVHQLKAANVPIMAGTDASMPGTTHGASLHRELELLVNAGLTPVDALAAATTVPAEIFGLSDRGHIAPGRRADLVLVEGDPSSNILATRRILGVWKRGVAVDRRVYSERLEQERHQAEHRQTPSGSESGLVSDFEDGTLSASFGSGWQVTTGIGGNGHSTAHMQTMPEGANGHKGSLLIAGDAQGDTPVDWAGAVFLPGATPWEPANLSSKKGLTFWAKGDGKTYLLLIFAGNVDKAPVPAAFIPFVAGAEWRPIRVDFSQLRYQIDTLSLCGIAFVAKPPTRQFAFQIDEVRFV